MLALKRRIKFTGTRRATRAIAVVNAGGRGQPAVTKKRNGFAGSHSAIFPVTLFANAARSTSWFATSWGSRFLISMHRFSRAYRFHLRSVEFLAVSAHISAANVGFPIFGSSFIALCPAYQGNRW